MRSLPLLLLLAASVPAMGQDAPAPVIIEMPSVAEWVEASFPEAATQAGIEQGRVIVRVSIDVKGTVLGAEVQSATPPDVGFEQQALDAILRTRFTPAISEEGPVPATFDFAYNFELTEDPEAAAQPAPINVDGRVRELGTRASIADALVSLKWRGEDPAPPAPPEITTDAQGAFSFRGVPDGPWRITVLGPIHVGFSEDIDVVAGEATNVESWLRVDSTASNEVVVFGERDRPPEVTRRSLTSKEIRRIPGTFGDPVKVIQTLPGAARSPFGTGLLIIRGANPEDSGVYVDGIRVPLIYHLTGTTSVIAPDLVDSVDYLPGGYAAKFGRTSAGTIDIQTVQSIDETRISAGADVLDAQVYAQTNIPLNKAGDKKLGVAVGARRSYIDAFLPLFLDGSNFSIKPRYYDYQVKLFAPTPAHRRLSLFVYGFDDTLSISTPADRAQGSDQDTQGAIATQYNSHRVILRWDEELRNNLTFRLVPAVGIDRTLFSVGNALTFDGTATQYQVRAELEWDATEAVRITPGADLLTGPWSFGFRAPLSVSDIDDPIGEREPVGLQGNGTATYPDTWLRFDLRPFNDRDRLLLVPSVRLNGLALTYKGQAAGEDPKPFTRTAVDPRFSGRFEVFDGFAVKASSGLYHQPPQPQESIGIGATPTLTYERAWNSSFGVEHKISDSIEYEVEGFYRDMTRLIDNNPDFGGFGEQPFANVGFGRAYGIETIVRHQPTGRFFGWVSYTLSRSERKGQKDAPWTAFDFDQTHIMSAQAGYDLPLDFGVSFQVQYVTGNPDTPLNAGVYDSDEGAYNGFRVGDVNGERLPDFFQTSLRFDKTFVYKSWELNTYVDLLNIVRGVNPEFTIYSFDYTDAAYVRGLPFIPNLGIEARIRR